MGYSWFLIFSVSFFVTTDHRDVMQLIIPTTYVVSMKQNCFLHRDFFIFITLAEIWQRMMKDFSNLRPSLLLFSVLSLFIAFILAFQVTFLFTMSSQTRREHSYVFTTLTFN